MKHLRTFFELLLIFILAVALYNSGKKKTEVIKPVPVITYEILNIDSSFKHTTGKYWYNLRDEKAIIWDPNFGVFCTEKLVPGYDQFALIKVKP